MNRKQSKNLIFLVLLCCCFLSCFPTKIKASSTPALSAQQATGGTLRTTKTGAKYQFKDGTYAKNVWLAIGEKTYYFNKNGVAVNGFFTYDKAKYYSTAKTGVYKSKWVTKNKKDYYLLGSGKMAASTFVKVSKKYYYVSKTGVKQKSKWIVVNNKKYYVDKSGVRLQNTWLKLKNKYYYFTANGVMAVNRWVGDYYVGANGARVTKGVIDGFTLGSDGSRGVLNTPTDYVMLGDSRFVGMKTVASNSKLYYIAKVGMGYSWLKSTAAPALKSYLKKKPTAKVVLALGVNDLSNIENYISYYKTLISTYPKASFYILAVNPVNETVAKKHGYSVKNTQITAFNKKMKAAFGSIYLDSYTYLKNNGFETVDGIHYQASSYKSVFNFIIESTNKK